MFLSNPAKFFPALILISSIFGGCGFFKSYIDRTPPEKGNTPFSVAEPEVFQGEFVSSSGENSTSSFYAKKGEDWRFDTAFGTENSKSVVKTDKLYSISHKKKIYAEMPPAQYQSSDPEFVGDLTFGLLKQVKYTRFEEAGRDGKVVKYKAWIGDNAASEALIYFDESVGMIVREEFTSLKGQTDSSPGPAFVFEIRNLQLSVDDSVFAMPAGYRKVAWNEYMTMVNKNG